MNNDMELVEREQQLRSLAAAWSQVKSGAGRVVLVSGEAGIGKTALIERFVADHGRGAWLLRGGCDDLFSPQPLGPFIEIVTQMEGGAVPLPSPGGRLAFSAEFLRAIQRHPRPVIVVLEDLHWADEATLDVVKFLGRRIQQTRALLILSYRNDEISSSHPLRSLLGDLPTQATLRLALSLLSPGAVERLAGAERRLEELYRVTGGNPFFVTEVLASQSEGVPPSVRDAVLARAARLSLAARAVLELASLVPGSAEGWLIAAVLQPDPAALDECVERGILRPVGRSPARRDLAFRHELARQSVEDTLPVGRARDLHGRILAALLPREGDVSLARLVHHAVRAGDEATTLRLAPQAARQAATLGAHRQALSLYTTLLRYAERLTPEAQAEILEALSIEYYLIDRAEDAIVTRLRAIDIWQRLGRDDRVGDGHRWLSRFHWIAGNGQAAEEQVNIAIDILSAHPPGPELAMAYSAKSQLHMLAWEDTLAVEWGNRAIALAEVLGATEILVHAMTNVGSIDTLQAYWAGTEKLEHALRLAREHEMHDHVGRCYSNLTSNHVRTRNYEAARRALDDGLEYTTARDLDTYTIYLLGWQAQLNLETGHWDEAEPPALEAMRLNQEQTITLLPAILTLGRLRARRGETAEAGRLLDNAFQLALPTRELQRLGPVASARAEAAWLRGDTERIAVEAEFGYDLAMSRSDVWLAGEVAYWRWRGGWRDNPPLERLADPFAAMIRGQWTAAAEMWQQIGCPYERALALADGDEAAQLQALALFDELGAAAAAALLRRQLQARGVAVVPRRRTPAADDLTPREREVLRLIAEGLSNPAIAQALTISVGTVKAHTAGIYSKLGVGNRVQALSRGQELGLL